MFTRIQSEANCRPRHVLTAFASCFARLQPCISDINQNLESEFCVWLWYRFHQSVSRNLPPPAAHLLTGEIQVTWAQYVHVRTQPVGDVEYQQFTGLRRVARWVLSPGSYTAQLSGRRTSYSVYLVIFPTSSLIQPFTVKRAKLTKTLRIIAVHIVKSSKTA